MKHHTFILLFALFASFHLHAQKDVHIRFVDAYTYDPISPELIRTINNSDFSTNIESNTISLTKPRMKKLTVVARDYVTGNFDMHMKKRWGDTLTLQLKPQQQIINAYYDRFFNDTTNTDTLTFASIKNVERKLRVHLNFVSEIDHTCDHGLCNNSNTFRYFAKFKQTDGVFALVSIKSQPVSETKCKDLEAFLDQIKNSFPPFKLEGEGEELLIPFTIFWY